MRNRSTRSLPHPRQPKRRCLLLAGCGDVGLRLLEQHGARPSGFAGEWSDNLPDKPHTRLPDKPHTEQALNKRPKLRIVATCRRAEQATRIRELGGTPLQGDLGNPQFLRRLAALSRAGLIWLAPPPATGETDPYSRRMLHALAASGIRRKRSVVYVSTTGVYGDRGGQWTDENTPVRPANARAVRRVDAENAWRGKRLKGHNRPARFLADLRSVTVLRAPGIYAAQRLPIDRLRAGTPAIESGQDSWSNHIHANDLARLCWRAVFRMQGRRVINAVDDEPMRMGDYFDKVADHFGLPRPPRLPRQAVKDLVSPMMWSFMNESRRLKNGRLRELRLHLYYPTVGDLLRSLTRCGTSPAVQGGEDVNPLGE